MEEPVHSGLRAQSQAIILGGTCFLLLATLGAATEGPAAVNAPQTVDQFLKSDGEVRVIAHRGFSGRAPENTLASIRKAIEIEADMAEIDVTLTADGAVVCLHDEKIGRTTNGRGRISDLTLVEARRFDAGSWFSPAFVGERIPTLDSVFEIAKGHILINIEIKPETVERGISAKIVEAVTAHGMKDHVLISSFSPEALAQIHELEPAIQTASLFNRKIHRRVDPEIIVGKVGSSMLNINRHYLSRQIRDRCARLEIPIGAYTANKRRTMEKLLDKGVHAIFTDHPDLLLEVLAERRSAVRNR